MEIGRAGLGCRRISAARFESAVRSFVSACVATEQTKLAMLVRTSSEPNFQAGLHRPPPGRGVAV